MCNTLKTPEKLNNIVEFHYSVQSIHLVFKPLLNHQFVGIWTPKRFTSIPVCAIHNVTVGFSLIHNIHRHSIVYMSSFQMFSHSVCWEKSLSMTLAPRFLLLSKLTWTDVQPSKVSDCCFYKLAIFVETYRVNRTTNCSVITIFWILNEVQVSLWHSTNV